MPLDMRKIAHILFCQCVAKPVKLFFAGVQVCGREGGQPHLQLPGLLDQLPSPHQLQHQRHHRRRLLRHHNPGELLGL
jgi:hypothetical protein